jgi:carbon storage regulator
MLVLSRKLNERILIGDSIVLTVVKIQGGNVRLGIEAPADVDIVRLELLKGRRASSGEVHPT